jgi:hypothetical protein
VIISSCGSFYTGNVLLLPIPVKDGASCRPTTVAP